MNALELAIEICALSHHYGDSAAALQDVSLSVAPGEAFALIGPNGSGKSTLLALLATRLKPRLAGSAVARVAGYDLHRQAAQVRCAIAVVFQHPSVDGKLTAEENLKYEAMLHGLRGAARSSRIEEALVAAGLTERRRDRVETFSGGMKRRLEIAKAMMHRPAVLMLDEPDTGLDVRALEAVWAQLAAHRAEHGTTLVLATHRMELAERCDRVAVLRAGAVVGQGSPDELRRRLPGGAVRVQAAAGEVDAVLTALAALRRDWTEASAPRVVGQDVVAYDESPAELAASLHERFGDRLDRVSYGRSTLHDVFLALTGEALVEVLPA